MVANMASSLVQEAESKNFIGKAVAIDRHSYNQANEMVRVRGVRGIGTQKAFVEDKIF
jgi:hypothetical protein